MGGDELESDEGFVDVVEVTFEVGLASQLLFRFEGGDGDVGYLSE